VGGGGGAWQVKIRGLREVEAGGMGGMGAQWAGAGHSGAGKIGAGVRPMQALR
jgi:hypothetical protein